MVGGRHFKKEKCTIIRADGVGETTARPPKLEARAPLNPNNFIRASRDRVYSGISHV